MPQQTVQDIMTTPVVTTSVETPFKEVVRLLAEHHISGVPVLGPHGVVAGVLSETDLLRKEEHLDGPGIGRMLTRHRRTARHKAAAELAGELMSMPAVTVPPHATLTQAARLMGQRGINRLPVVASAGELVGIVTRSDLLAVFLRSDAAIRTEVVRDVLTHALLIDPETVRVAVRDGVVTVDGSVERRSSAHLAVELTRRVDGVVDVVDRLAYLTDDIGRRSGHARR